jgi:hypothetical protein
LPACSASEEKESLLRRHREQSTAAAEAHAAEVADLNQRLQDQAAQAQERYDCYK